MAIFGLSGLHFFLFRRFGHSFPFILAFWCFISFHFGLLGLHFLSFWPFGLDLLSFWLFGPSFSFILAFSAFIFFHFGLLGLHFLSFWGCHVGSPPTSCQKRSCFLIKFKQILSAAKLAAFCYFWPFGPSFPFILAFWAFISFHFGLLGLHFLSFWFLGLHFFRFWLFVLSFPLILAFSAFISFQFLLAVAATWVSPHWGFISLFRQLLVHFCPFRTDARSPLHLNFACGPLPQLRKTPTWDLPAPGLGSKIHHKRNINSRRYHSHHHQRQQQQQQQNNNNNHNSNNNNNNNQQKRKSMFWKPRTAYTKVTMTKIRTGRTKTREEHKGTNQIRTLSIAGSFSWLPSQPLLCLCSFFASSLLFLCSFSAPSLHLQFPSTAARSSRPFCDFALGPSVLLWTNSNIHAVKLWQQSRRAQKPDIVDIVVPNRLLGRSVVGFLFHGETCFVLGLSSTSQLKSLRQEPTGCGRSPGGARRRKHA